MKHELERLIATIRQNHGLDISLYEEVQAVLNKPKLYTIKTEYKHLYPMLNLWVGTAKMFVNSDTDIEHLRTVDLQSEMEALIKETDNDHSRKVVTFLLNILYASQQ